MQKVLDSANIKLASVASDVLGVSGRAMLHRLVAGETDPKVLADLAVGRLRAKYEARIPALLEGRMGDHQRFLLGQLLGPRLRVSIYGKWIFKSSEYSAKMLSDMSTLLFWEPFPLCRKLRLWITFIWYDVPQKGRRDHPGRVCRGRAEEEPVRRVQGNSPVRSTGFLHPIFGIRRDVYMASGLKRSRPNFANAPDLAYPQFVLSE